MSHDATPAVPDTAHGIASAVRAGRLKATAVVGAAISEISLRDRAYNSVTRILGPRAIGLAEQVDRKVAAGEDPGPLAGVPFGIKDLFDCEGETTTAGSTVLRESAPAPRDAAIVERLRLAGAIPLATTNMDEFAYGFATDNAHYGITRNPHDTTRLAGGSSGGSAAAVAAGLLPLSLGTDTNGSIRVPASLCGLWAIRPTQGRLPKAGTYPFAASFDTVGPFTRDLADLKVAFDALDMHGNREPAPPELRVARLGGWFAENVSDKLESAIGDVMAAFGSNEIVELPEVARARAAAFLITAAEGGALHLPRLRAHASAYDPATRDRLLAGALLPARTVYQAQRLRRWFREQAYVAFARADVLVAPAVVGEAPRIDQPLIEIDGQMVSARANLGLYTQPLTLTGFPIMSVPLKTPGLPVGLQLMALPGKEEALFAAAEVLAKAGLAVAASVPG
ncbi:amidohydrolase, AtzE family [Tanticharoenia sakaeratensis NBRC 103193]|uniref:Amidohydrolase, AtzE family n=2 Tax=Tanticharoenia TaxID=444052 RepID=A0A0D6MKQ1_9PROT|nr:AtzE family amidohydrolase [Tanticharoenia sakaeratensis]GAN53843.1 amidohydrolase, AtzE family [Tanticharoenia sakaeratensis NBRC 103193]